MNIENKKDISHIIESHQYVKELFTDKVSNVEDDFALDLFEIAEGEIKENLDKVELILEQHDSNSNIHNLLEAKRALHTLKGSARMVGLNKIGSIAHRLESLLEYAETRSIGIEYFKEIIQSEVEKVSYLLDNKNELLPKNIIYWLDNLTDAEDGETREFNQDIVEIPIHEEHRHDKLDHDFSIDVNSIIDNKNINKISNISETVMSTTTSTHTETKKVHPHHIENQTQSIKVDSRLVDTVINDISEIRLSKTALETTLDSNKKAVFDLKATANQLQKIVREIEIQAEAQIQSRKEQLSAHNEIFDPLEFDQYTRLQELTRFLAENVHDINDALVSLDSSNNRENEIVERQTLLTNNLLSELMKVRLVTLDSISERLYRITRNTTIELNKKVRLELFGEKTEIDRIILDKIIVSLEHLIRNCIAHGIESEELRKINDKNPIGKITLDAKIEGNYVVMSLKDDGAGINLERITEVAKEKGLYDHNKQYTDKELIAFIFNSGFSTAKNVNQISGRGYGMDIVYNQIISLGGTIEVNSVSGHGTEFVISLPVSVSTNQVVLVQTSNDVIAIPIDLVEEVTYLKHNDLVSAYNNKYILHDGKKTELIYLGHLMGGPTPITDMPNIKVYNTLLTINHLGQKLIVHVDSLNSTTDILVKGVGSFISKISGFVGYSVLGDGKQVIMVNPFLLKKHFDTYIKPKIDSLQINKAKSADDLAKTLLEPVITSNYEEKYKEKITVLVVDDSLTVRKTTEKVLSAYGYDVILAKHGEDALDKLQIQIPDIILSDIEMPIMDGFDFVKNLKNNIKYAQIPVIMITSRTADKHKNYAYSLGVNGFLGKPYQNEELVEKIKQLVKDSSLIIND